MANTLTKSLFLLTLAAPAVGHAQAGGFPSSLDSTTLNRWLITQTTLKPADVIAVGGGRVVGVVSRTKAPSGRVLLGIRTEIVTEAAAQDAKARSESVVLEVDCTDRRAKAGPTQSYSQHNLSGQLGVKPGWADWAQAGPGSTLDRMVQAACGATGRSTAGLPPSRAPALAAPPPAPVAAEPLPEPAPEPAPVIAQPPAPAPAPRAPPPPPPPPPQAEPIPASPPPVRSPEPAPGPPAAAVVSRPAAPPSSASGRATGRFASWAQIAVTGSDADARAALARLTAESPDAASRPTLVEETPLGGQTFYRALIGGFANGVEAGAFCQKLAATGATCTVRQR